MTKSAKEKKAKRAVKSENTTTSEQQVAVTEETAPQPETKPSKVKTPHSAAKKTYAAIASVFTVILGVASGFLFSLVSLAKSEAIYCSIKENAATAAAQGYDTRLINTLFNQRLPYVVLFAIGVVFLVALYGGRKRAYYLIAYALTNTAAMLVMNYFFLLKTAGMTEAYLPVYNRYFWLILCSVFTGAILTEIFLLTFSVLRFRRLESKGIVREDGYFMDNLPEEEPDEDAAPDTVSVDASTDAAEPQKKEKKKIKFGRKTA